jgi:3-phenylpropionate/trans-cinnamate dioxygenase ferredoxin reductase subunit
VSAGRHEFLIVGGGIAAAHCASELRAQGAEGSILVATRETDPPYERPPLSKSYLGGESSREEA